VPQGLFMLMTNGIGATVGSLAAQKVVNVFGEGGVATPQCWEIFASYALVVGVAFLLIFRPKKDEIAKA